MSVLIKGGRVITAADDYVGDIFVEDERISLIGEIARRRSRQGDRRVRQVRPAGRGRSAHAPRHAVRGHDDDRRRRVGPEGGGARRHHLPRRLLHPGAGHELRGLARGLEVEGRRQAADRHGLPHRGHRPEGGRLAGGARVAARPGHHLLQALHGLQGRADGRRRDALQDDGGRGRDGGARDGARRERRRDRRAREEGARRREDRAQVPRADAAARDRGRGDEPGDPAGARRRLLALRRPRLLPGVRGADHAGAREGLGRLGRDVHAVLLRRLHVPRAPELRGREVRLHAAAARQGEPGRALGRGAARHAERDLHRPLRLPLGRARRRSARTTSRRSRTAGRASRTGST